MNLVAPSAEQLVEEPIYECSTCRDSGWRKIKADSEGRVTKCECKLPANSPALVRQTMEAAGMEADEIASAFGAWDESHQPKPTFAKDWLFGAMSGELEGVRDPWCLGLLGDPGRGKTKTAAVCMRYFIEAGGHRPLWVRATEGFKRSQAERRSDAYLEQDALEEQIKRAGLCVIDDYGLGERNADLMEAVTNEWLAMRHRRHLLTILTCNAASLEDLDAPRIESRLAEGVYRVMRADSDFRDRGRHEIASRYALEVLHPAEFDEKVRGEIRSGERTVPTFEEWEEGLCT